MRWNNAYIPTLKEIPKGIEGRSHILSIRAGLMTSLMSGVHIYLPLGWKVLMKIMSIIREEMNKIGAQELFLPALSPSYLWKETGRWEEYGKDMFKFKDRKATDVCLAPTHEEIVTEIARKGIFSYKDLPQIWYQIQTKFRDEPRPRGGMLRAREFIMKDSYSFDSSDSNFEKSYSLHKEAYKNIFKRCGLDFTIVEASGGLMGRDFSEEFMVFSETGEDSIVICEDCGYKSNREIATSDSNIQDFKDESLEEVYTPCEGNVEEVSKFLNIPKQNLMKSLLYKKNGETLFILVDGAHEINEQKLKEIGNLRIATREEILDEIGAEPGYIGPVGLKIKTFSDISLKGKKGLVTGANKNMYHIKGINLERDVRVEKYVDVKLVEEGDVCVKCGGKLQIKNAIEIGHIFKLGEKYSKSMGAFFLDASGERKPVIMGSYGIGVERIMMSVIETSSDENGIIWPISITPYEFLVLPINSEKPEVKKLSEEIYNELISKKNDDILIDDRNESPGVKFKDADLIGIPFQIIIGEKGLKKGIVELVKRNNKKKWEINIDSGKRKVVSEILELSAKVENT